MTISNSSYVQPLRQFSSSFTAYSKSLATLGVVAAKYNTSSNSVRPLHGCKLIVVFCVCTVYVFSEFSGEHAAALQNVNKTCMVRMYVHTVIMSQNQF